ncbi:flippase [Chloroflexota bacterium]
MSWSLVNSVTILISAFIGRLLLGNYLDASSLGILTMTTYLFGIITFVFSFSLGMAVTKFVAEFKDRPEERNTYVSLALVMSFSFGLIALGVTVALSGWLSGFYNMPELVRFLPILSITLPTAISLSIFQYMLLGLRELRRYAIITIVSNVLLLALTAYFLIMGWGLFWVILTIVITHLIMLPAILLYTKRFYRVSLAKFKVISLKMLSFSSKIYGANLVSFVQQRADVLIMGFFLAASDIGIYSIALMLPRILQVIPDAMSTVNFPAMSEYHGKGMTEAVEFLVNKSIKYSLIIVSFLGLICIFFNEQILLLLFPGRLEYLQGATAIQILCAGVIVLPVASAVAGCFTAAGRPEIAIIASLVMTAVAVGLNVLLIKPLGINGTAIATGASYLAVSAVSFVLYRPILKIKADWVNVTKILLSTSGSAMFGILLGNIVSWYVAGALGLLLWFLLILLLKCISREDINYLPAMLRG